MQVPPRKTQKKKHIWPGVRLPGKRFISGKGLVGPVHRGQCLGLGMGKGRGEWRGEGQRRAGHSPACLLPVFTSRAEASSSLLACGPCTHHWLPCKAVTLSPDPQPLPHYPQEHLNYVTEIAQDEIYILDPELLGTSARPDLPTPTSPLPTSPCSPTPQ